MTVLGHVNQTGPQVFAGQAEHFDDLGHLMALKGHGFLAAASTCHVVIVVATWCQASDCGRGGVRIGGIGFHFRFFTFEDGAKG